jgi:hypothetical protein
MYPKNVCLFLFVFVCFCFCLFLFLFLFVLVLFLFLSTRTLCKIFDSRATAILVQMERQIKGVESKIVSLRSHDHNSLESGTIVKVS